MAINNVTGLPGSQTPRTTEGSQVQVARNEPTATQDETGRPSTLDTVSLTDTSAKLQHLDNTISQLPVVDSQHVEALRQAIDNGSFKADSSRIAGKMMNMERALGGRG